MDCLSVVVAGASDSLATNGLCMKSKTLFERWGLNALNLINKNNVRQRTISGRV